MVWNDMQWFDIHCHSCWCNDMQGYVLHWHTLPFLLMQTFWMDTYWMDTFDLAYWMDTYWCMFCIHIHCRSCWCIPFEWIRIEWNRIEWIRMILRIEWIRIEGIRIEGIRIGGIRIDAIRVEWIRIEKICVGWCLLICMVWFTPTIFWRNLRRNIFREKQLSFHPLFLKPLWRDPDLGVGLLRSPLASALPGLHHPYPRISPVCALRPTPFLPISLWLQLMRFLELREECRFEGKKYPGLPAGWSTPSKRPATNVYI